jgi:glucokinase
LGHIATANLRPVIPGPVQAGASMLVVGLGTGVNAAPVHGTGAARVVPPSECGHVNMPVRTGADLRLAHFVETAHGFPGVEDVMSGRGLERLHAFVTTEAGAPAEVPASTWKGKACAGPAVRLSSWPMACSAPAW